MKLPAPITTRFRMVCIATCLLLAASLSAPSGYLLPASAQAGNRVCFNLDGNWGTGLQGSFKITNTGSAPISNWRLEFDFTQSISSLWDARLTSRSGNHYVVDFPNWSPNIAPGATVSFGFIASLSGTFVSPANFRLNGSATSCTGAPTDTQAPAAPANLRVTATTATSISLAWNASTDNVGVTSYEISRGGASAGTSTATAFTATGLAPNTTYTFTVTARDAAGNVSAASNAVNATTQPQPVDIQPPTVPTNLRVAGTTSTTVSLAWDVSTDNVGVTGYDVSRGSTPAGTTMITIFTATELTPSTTYTFSVRARDAAGNVSDPSNSVTATTQSGGCTGNKLLVGYWHNFNNGSGFIKLRDVSPNWDVINLAFGEPRSGSTSDIQFVPDPGNTTPEEVKSDIAILKSRGKRVLLSIGGANGRVQLNTAADRQSFVNSVTGIIQEYGLDGLDIDFEGNSLFLDQNDTDFRNPTTPVITNLISAIREIRTRIGSGLILTFAPETFFVQVGYSFYGSGPFGGDNRRGAYLPVIHAVRDILTYVYVQHYNSGSITALDNQFYSAGTADFHVAMAEMLLQGFPVARNPNMVFEPLRQDQVMFGIPATTQAGNGFTPSAEVHRALNYLVRGQSFGGGYVLRNPAGYPGFKGLMSWSINWDAFGAFDFSRTHRAFLDSLGGCQ
jgi:chitinase